MSTIAVDAPTEFEQSLDAELVRLNEMKSDLQSELNDVEQSIEQIEAFRGSYVPNPRAVERTPAAAPAPTRPPVKKPAKKPKSTATKVARSMVENPPAQAPSAEIDEAILKFLTTFSIPAKGPEIYAGVDFDESSVKYRLVKLVEAGKVKRTGVARGTKYEIPTGAQVGGAKPAAKKTAPPPDSGTQQPRLEGRVFSLLQYQRLSSQKLADELEVSVDEVREVLAKMLDEDEVRKFGEFPYDTWEGTGL